jgi:hypothetical protein
MSLAEVSNALQQKDVEKNVVLAEIEKLRVCARRDLIEIFYMILAL